MSARIFIIGAAVVVVGAIGVAWHDARLIRDADDRLRATNLRCTAVTAEIQQTVRRLATADQNAAELQTALSALGGAQKTKATPTPTAPAGPSIVERLRTEPDTQVLWLRLQRSRLAARYGPFFQALHLSTSQIEKLEDIAVNRDERNMDLTATLQTQRLPSGSSTAVKLRQDIDAEYESARQSLLGEADYRQLKDYERTLYVRDMMNGWAGGATVIAREPLSHQQGEQLVQIIANANASFREGGGNGVAGDIDWETVDEQARMILSDAQFDLFKTMEPPLPTGGRYQQVLYELVAKAQRTEATAAPGSPVK